MTRAARPWHPWPPADGADALALARLQSVWPAVARALGPDAPARWVLRPWGRAGATVWLTPTGTLETDALPPEAAVTPPRGVWVTLAVVGVGVPPWLVATGRVGPLQAVAVLATAWALPIGMLALEAWRPRTMGGPLTATELARAVAHLRARLPATADLARLDAAVRGPFAP